MQTAFLPPELRISFMRRLDAMVQTVRPSSIRPPHPPRQGTAYSPALHAQKAATKSRKDRIALLRPPARPLNAKIPTENTIGWNFCFFHPPTPGQAPLSTGLISSSCRPSRRPTRFRKVGLARPFYYKTLKVLFHAYTGWRQRRRRRQPVPRHTRRHGGGRASQ